jgi:hypothetical protein
MENKSPVQTIGTKENPEMFKNSIIGISFVAATLLSTAAFAEYAVIADPEHYTVEFEIDSVLPHTINQAALVKSTDNSGN